MFLLVLVHEDWHLITWFRPNHPQPLKHHVECKQNPMNSWGDVLRKTPTGAHACLELIEGNRMQWLQRSHAWPCCRCWGHFVSQGNNRTQIKTQTSSWGRNYHKWSKNVQDFHHRCQWNSKNARHIQTHFQVFQQMISPWPVPMLQHDVASLPQNQICKSKQSTLPPILMVQWRMGPYKISFLEKREAIFHFLWEDG